jgi:hypothetical protein
VSFNKILNRYEACVTWPEYRFREWSDKQGLTPLDVADGLEAAAKRIREIESGRPKPEAPKVPPSDAPLRPTVGDFKKVTRKPRKRDAKR